MKGGDKSRTQDWERDYVQELRVRWRKWWDCQWGLVVLSEKKNDGRNGGRRFGMRIMRRERGRIKLNCKEKKNVIRGGKWKERNIRRKVRIRKKRNYEKYIIISEEERNKVYQRKRLTQQKQLSIKKKKNEGKLKVDK